MIVDELLTSSAELLSQGLVDRRIYSDPDIYRLERRRVFARSWLVVGHESQIPSAGDFLESYMGEESVVLCRNRDGEVRVLLNTCRHRGNKVCRAELGNARAFLCQYHGWTYDLDGRFIGAPNFEPLYGEDLKREEWGLLSAQVASYKGLVFATFNRQAPPLEDFLGEFAWILDAILNPRPGGVEVAGGFLRWMINMNWKFGAENSGGDVYHGVTTHRSAQDIGHLPIASEYRAEDGAGKRAQDSALRPGYTMVTPEGHAVNWNEVERSVEVVPSQGERAASPLERYYEQRVSDTVGQLGEYRARNLGRFNANVFPNAGFHTSAQTIHLLHPKGPNRTEVWLLPLVDRRAPEEVKEWVRRRADHHFGPAGFFEEDDGENWEQATAACSGEVASGLPFNLQMGLGREKYVQPAGMPRVIEGACNEYGQRAFLRRWHEMMLAPDEARVEAAK